ncbi:co-chaperone GroES [Halonatronum saccharophilum]|uniref:co-chaperone GroES n=1 Tax=Halonatronum saccharophilum TaxID=150060 RepID=UPI0004828A6F|nr:co-chaperone GroES [Halonatronum saccharophilum]
MSIKPLGDRVVIKSVEAKEEKTKSGIVLPDSAKEKPQQGEVVAVGSGRKLDSGETIAPEVNAGDIVIYSKFAGSDIKHNGEEYLIISEKDVLAIVK